jgi:hypothetical protein
VARAASRTSVALPFAKEGGAAAKDIELHP